MTGSSDPSASAAARQEAASQPRRDRATGQGRAGWLQRLRPTRANASTWLPALLAVLLIVAAFATMVARAVEMGFHNRQPVWVVDAIPPVLSEQYYGHQKRYTALAEVQRRFFARVNREVATAESINAAMRRLAETGTNSAGESYVLLGPDDKGIVDLVGASFRLFGLRTSSILTLYFAILLASSALYVVAFWRSASALLLLAAFLVMFTLVMPMLMYNPQLRSLLALRVLPILSMVACLHALMFVATSLHRRIGVLSVILLALQIALISFTIHLRSTTLWQVATIMGFGVAALVVPQVVARIRRVNVPLLPGRSTLLGAGVATGLMIAGYVGLQVYQATALPEEYRRGDEIATRVFWHNVFTGFAYHPELQGRFKIWLDDVSIMAATRDYLSEIGRADVWRDMGGTETGFEGVKFAKYDPIVRDMLVARCTVFVRECLETFLWYKPVSLVQNLAWLYGFRELPPDLDVADSPYFGDILKRQFLGTSDGLDRSGRRAYLWTPAALLVIVPFVALLLLEPRPLAWPTLSAGVALALGATIPTVVGYAAPHTVAEAAIAFGMVIYLGGCLAVAGGVRAILRMARTTPV